MTETKGKRCVEKYTYAEMAEHMRNLYSDKDCYEVEVLTEAIKLFNAKSELIAKVLAELNRIGRLLWFNTGSMKAGNLTYDDWLKFKKRIEEL